MKFIKASWKGFEIDSSEFWVIIETNDVPKTIKAFSESPYIEGGGKGKKRSGNNYVPAFLEALEVAKVENLEKLKEIKIGEKTILEKAKEYKKIYEEAEAERTEEFVDLLELSIAIKFLTQEFPHLSFAFDKCDVTFYRKSNDEEGTNEYTFSLSGRPIQYMVNWYTTDEWNAVLQSIGRKAPISWNTGI